ncbi:hypothetical protein AAEH85_21660, partial [Shewanella algae]
MAFAVQPATKTGWKLSIDQEDHGSFRRNDGTMLGRSGSIQQCSGDIVVFEIGVIGENFSARRAAGQCIENIADADPQAANARAS